MIKTICLLGSSGSIGKSTLDVVSRHSHRFSIHTLVVNKSVDLLCEQIEKFKPRYAVAYNQEAYRKLQTSNIPHGTTIGFGMDGLQKALDEKPDIFVNAFVGFAGLEPTIAAVKKGISVALANKETLVVAGELINNLLKEYKTDMIPIDSEHSAIWQCLAGEDGNKVRRLILTASGGPFRTFSREQLKSVTQEQALKHPNWDMGAKITIDSATLMNKGLEVIEAHWLYDLPPARIEVIVHPQSIIHSMVEFEDKSVKAQLGLPDMRIPIQYALSYPDRLGLDLPPMDFIKTQSLTFEEPDLKKFPCLRLAYQVLEAGDSYPAVLNAANEVAVSRFLNREITFTGIPLLIEDMINQHIPIKNATWPDLAELDKKIRAETAKREMKQFKS